MGWEIRWTFLSIKLLDSRFCAGPLTEVGLSGFSWLTWHLPLFCAGLIGTCLWCTGTHGIGEGANGHSSLTLSDIRVHNEELPQLLQFLVLTSCTKDALCEPLAICWGSHLVVFLIMSFLKAAQLVLAMSPCGRLSVFPWDRVLPLLQYPTLFFYFYFFGKRHLKGSLVWEHRLWLQRKHEAWSLCLWPAECFAS